MLIYIFVCFVRVSCTDLPDSGVGPNEVLGSELSPQHHKSVIYNGPNNFIDSPGGEQEATALNHGCLKVAISPFFNLSCVHILRVAT